MRLSMLSETQAFIQLRGTFAEPMTDSFTQHLADLCMQPVVLWLLSKGESLWLIPFFFLAASSSAVDCMVAFYFPLFPLSNSLLFFFKRKQSRKALQTSHNNNKKNTYCFSSPK